MFNLDDFMNDLAQEMNEGYKRSIREGRGFRVELDPPDDRINQDARACLARWNMYLPGQSPVWSWYSLNVVHLRDLPSLTKPNLRFPAATHEILLCANDPARDEMSEQGAVSPLEPHNLVEQFHFQTDRHAIDACQKCFDLCMNTNTDHEFPQLICEMGGITGMRDMWVEVITRAGGWQPS